MKVDRLVSIIMILLNKKRIGAKELADMFEVSLRTIYRDVNAINLAGIPVHSSPGVGGGFEIMPEYKISNKVFSADDLSAILTGLSGVSEMISDKELANAAAKVRSFIPDDKAKYIELRTSQICIDPDPWISAGNIRPYIELIKTALQEKRLIEFDYSGRRGEKARRTVEPYQLVLKSNHWYCYGFCLNRNDFRLFKLSRICGLQMKEETYLPREFRKPQLDFNDALDTIKTIVTIRIHNSIMDRVLDYCTMDYFTPDDHDHSFVSFPFIENEYYYGVLLSFGSNCECLEPLHIRDEMQRRINDMAALYDHQHPIIIR